MRQTQELLNLLADSIGTAKILLLVNYRPEYSHSWGSKTYYTQLRLDPLGKESAGEMLSALLSDGEELAALKRVIIEKTEGNPFFMEETVQVLLDEGALVRDGRAVRAHPAPSRAQDSAHRPGRSSPHGSIGCLRRRRSCCKRWPQSVWTFRPAWSGR